MTAFIDMSDVEVSERLYQCGMTLSIAGLALDRQSEDYPTDPRLFELRQQIRDLMKETFALHKSLQPSHPGLKVVSID